MTDAPVAPASASRAAKKGGKKSCYRLEIQKADNGGFIVEKYYRGDTESKGGYPGEYHPPTKAVFESLDGLKSMIDETLGSMDA